MMAPLPTTAHVHMTAKKTLDLANPYGFSTQQRGGRHCQVDEKCVDRPQRYWALARREPTMLGIKNGRQPQLDNTQFLVTFS